MALYPLVTLTPGGSGTGQDPANRALKDASPHRDACPHISGTFPVRCWGHGLEVLLHGGPRTGCQRSWAAGPGSDPLPQVLGHPLLHLGSTVAWRDTRQSSRAAAQAPPWLQTQSLDVTRATDSPQRVSVAIRGWALMAAARGLPGEPAHGDFPSLSWAGARSTLWWQSLATRCHCRNTRTTPACSRANALQETPRPTTELGALPGIPRPSPGRASS